MSTPREENRVRPRVPKVHKKDEYARYNALIRDLELRESLDAASRLASAIPAVGEAGPSDWQGEEEREESVETTTSSAHTAPERRKKPKSKRNKAAPELRWPAPNDKQRDSLGQEANYLSEALESYATTQIYLSALSYPPDPRTSPSQSVDAQELLGVNLPPGVALAAVQLLNSTLQDLAAIRPPGYKTEMSQFKAISWASVLRVAAKYCPPQVMAQAMRRMQHITHATDGLTLSDRLESLNARCSRSSSFHVNLLDPVMPDKPTKPSRKRKRAASAQA